MADETLGKYRLLRKLATGGMAEVWLARQIGIEGFNRHVVVKRVLPHLAEDPEFVSMFLQEARIASRFNHPNIAQIYDLGEQGGTYFIAMEFIHGEDLGRVMRRAWSTGQWVARPLAIRIVADSAAGLYYAHSRMDEQGRPLRIVHRDISPQNILVSFDGSVKLVDFGIAKAADQVSNTKSGAIKGKFAYMAPEQARGRLPDARSDILALGLVLFELITGVRPLKRDSEIATLQAALECAIEKPSLVAEVPSSLDDVVMRALAKDPEDRYRDARQFQMALEQYLVQEGTVATSVQVSELMETLFADRIQEEARLGVPAPSTESSMSNAGGFFGGGRRSVSLGAIGSAHSHLDHATHLSPLSEVVEELVGRVPDVTNAAARRVLKDGVRQAELARRSDDADGKRVQRLAAALELLGAAERSLHARLYRLTNDEREHWLAVLEETHGKAVPTRLSDRQVHSFLSKGELPSLKSLAHWLSPQDGPEPEDLAEHLRALLGVPTSLRAGLFALGQCRNVLAHRQTYEARGDDLGEAATHLRWIRIEGANVIDISEEHLDTMRVVCTRIVKRR